MLNVLKNNAYHILGLNITATQGDILKRAREIIKRLKIDNFPEYNLDLGLFDNFRTEESVNEAVQKLQTPKKRIKEYFFWFYIVDNIDEQALGLIKFGDFENALRVWENVAEKEGIKSFFYKKNLAVLYCLLLYIKDDERYLKNSLSIWKELIESDKFWAIFLKTYNLHNEQAANQTLISDFRKHAANYLADIYTELSEIHQNADYISQFQKIFSVKGKKIEKDILQPTYEAISNAVEELEKINIGENSVFNKEKIKKIKQLVGKIQNELNKLIDIGLYDDSQTKIMRDKVANALRSISIDLHNNLSELNKSQKLLEVAVQLAGTAGLKNKLLGDLKQIKENIENDIGRPFVIEIPGYINGRNIIVFKDDFLDYGDKRILFKDILSISFNSTKHTTAIYSIPISTSYTYRWSVTSRENNISLSFSASREESWEKEVWIKLVSLSLNLIEPHIIKRIIDQIFNRGEVVKIGDIEFSKQGYSKIKFKLFRKKEKLTVHWTDVIHIPVFKSGMVILWEDKDGKAEQFSAIPMSIPNAVILPELIRVCRGNQKG